MKTHEMHDWLKAGAHYRSKGNYEKALEAFAQARLALLCEMGECLASLGQLNEGIALFEEVLESNSADVRANAGMGVIALLAGDTGMAETAFGNVLHLDPGNAKALCGLGMAKKTNGQLEEAHSLLLQSLEKDSYQKSALQALAHISLSLGDVENVLPLLRKYLKRYPDDVEIAADLHALAGTAPQAPVIEPASAEQLQRSLAAFRAAPDDPGVVNGLLNILCMLGRKNEAHEVRNVCIGRNPGMKSVLLQF